MKKILFFIPLLILSGCGLFGSSGTVFHTFEGLTNAEFYSFEKYGGSGANTEVAILTEQNELDALKSVLDSASDGVRANSEELVPAYDLLVDHDAGDTILHLILGDAGEESRIMYAGYENEHFIIPEEGTATLIELIDID
ncbi:hypothetical protein [Geomicrobium sediminis]|uniref:DUF4825 domain-containing protein n=1 Tax=Geomicrobium sediminis TaxID=1347788 RepID=A0ABS2PH13_9BACL|nr:hypothetical protein [Geomicrobium sediminis]EZH64324.1 hypothetical protein DH09_00990 [Bacillaceae bacterium JMAK1]MBM7634236.1 hypothetical protein [Geomicrobium sediminis]